MRQIEACYAVGNANKEFSNGKTKFLNYLEKGFDLAFELQTDTLKKVIMHANQYLEPNFGFYDRCSFELNLPGIDLPITPLSCFSALREDLSKFGDVDRYFVNNPPSGGIHMKKTHVYGFEGFLLEVLPETDQISAVTIF